MIVLGIESTCDETGCAIVRDGREILANVVSSQIDLHAQYGGVVPELACRRHADIMIPIIDEALKKAQLTLDQIDRIAVAEQPGLIGALFIGLSTAKALALALNKPCIPINHIEAHLYAALMSHPAPQFPCLGVVLSGGHTSLFFMPNAHTFLPIAKTVDDAIGEAFDKVAKMMQLPYPGGPHMEQMAFHGDPHRFSFRAGQVKGSPLDFSFSGLKTAVLYEIKDRTLTWTDKCDVAASFQQAAFSDVIQKTLLAAKERGCCTIVFGGGVTNSQTLRKQFTQQGKGHTLLWPAPGLSLDNAAMIAGLASIK